jgi:hypothetical protein
MMKRVMSAYALVTSDLLSEDGTGSQNSGRFLFRVNKKGSVESVKSGPERGLLALPCPSLILEGGCECAVNLDHLLRISVHSSDVSNKSCTKSKFFKDMKDVRVFHIVKGRGLIKVYDC